MANRIVSRDSGYTMDSSGQDNFRDVTHSGKTTVLEVSSQESVKNCADSSKLGRLVNEGKGCLSKRKAKVHDMPPPSPPNATRLFQPLIPEDTSLESDEALEENYKRDTADLMRNVSDMAKGLPLSSSHNHSFDFLALKENIVDGGGNLTQDLLDSIGLGNSCSCSFCLKASHMWTDLIFQDTRGRLTELQKSKRRAADQIANVTEDFSTVSKSTKLEFDLMQHWKTIFIQTQDALVHEIVQTRLDLQERSKLMENCKRELESRSSVLLDKP